MIPKRQPELRRVFSGQRQARDMHETVQQEVGNHDGGEDKEGAPMVQPLGSGDDVPEKSAPQKQWYEAVRIRKSKGEVVAGGKVGRDVSLFEAHRGEDAQKEICEKRPKNQPARVQARRGSRSAQCHRGVPHTHALILLLSTAATVFSKDSLS